MTEAQFRPMTSRRAPRRPTRTTRFSQRPRDDKGGGYAESIVYDSESDTFQVDNLAFDGDTEGRSDYSRGTAVSSLGLYAVYEAPEVALDTYNGREVDQLQYRTIYGVSSSGKTEFTIVRTGGYVSYGFGGFVYQRDGGIFLISVRGSTPESTSVYEISGVPVRWNIQSVTSRCRWTSKTAMGGAV